MGGEKGIEGERSDGGDANLLTAVAEKKTLEVVRSLGGKKGEQGGKGRAYEGEGKLLSPSFLPSARGPLSYS